MLIITQNIYVITDKERDDLKCEVINVIIKICIKNEFIIENVQSGIVFNLNKNFKAYNLLELLVSSGNHNLLTKIVHLLCIFVKLRKSVI